MMDETPTDSTQVSLEPPPQATFAEIIAAAPSPVVTIVLIAVNLAIFVAMIVAGFSPISPQTQQVLQWGANYGPLTLNGQWWRVITACFLHFGVIHVGMNMFILFQAGQLTEKLYGSVRFFVLYMLAGIFGNVLGVWIHPNTVAAGASGSVFGVYGGLLAFLVAQQGVVPKPAAVAIAKSAGIFVVYNLIYSLRPGTDMVAHVGGLLGGFVVGCVLARPISIEGPRLYPVRTLLTCAVGALLAAAGLYVLKSRVPQAEESLQAFALTGQSITVNKNNRVYYRGTATRADAEKLGQALSQMGYFRATTNGLVILTNGPQGVALSLLTNEYNTSKVHNNQPALQSTDKRLVPYPWDDPKYLNAARYVGTRVAPAVGGPPLQLEILDRQGEVEKTLRIEDHLAIFNTRDMVWYRGTATQDDAQRLAAVLSKDGIFTGTGRQVYLAKDEKGYTVSFTVSDGLGNNPGVIRGFEAVKKHVAAAFHGSALEVRLLDSSLATQKVLP